MEKEQEIEWAKAQNIAVSVDLLEAAKKQLEFLAAVDRNRYLYESPAMEWAIYRYNAFWLPLLAKHSENAVSEDPLVVPFDCEWIWHCHRLNPVRYKSDCEERFGRILGNRNIISSVQGISKSRTEELWNKMYPEESYELDCNRSFPGDSLQKNVQNEKFTSYDLVSAAKRQVPFSFQVARPHMSDDLFLQEAVARYKGFLHLIRTNRKNNIKRFCVPTYDVDLIWHTHQLNPVSYCNDLLKLMGKVLEHDDTDSDRTKGKKLDTGFSDTTKQWEDTFGLRYWKAGAMYRGATPTPVTQLPIPFTYEAKKLHAPDICDNFIQFPEMKAIEVLLEFVEIKNLPEAHKGNIHVSFRKKQPDNLFSAKRTLSILSESGEKQVAYFQCEPTGEFLFELECHSPSYIPLPKSFKPFGSCSLSLQECVASGSQLTVNKWLPVVPLPGILASKPILLHVSLSCTLPTSAVQVFHLLWPQPFLKSSCYFPLPKIGKIKHAKSRTCITDDDGNDVLNLQMRESSKDMTRSTPGLLKEVHYITGSGETHSLAEFQGNGWLIKGTHGSFKLHNTSGNDGHLFELVGHKMMKLFAGRRLDFEPKHCKKQSSEHDFMTAVEFSAKYPYGRATALIDFKNGTFKVKDEWMILTGITLAFILSDILKRKGGFTAKVGSKENILNQVIQVITSPGNAENVIEAKVEEACGDIGIQGNSQSGGCGSGCGSGCGNMVQSGGCGSGCGSGCGNMVQSGGCGSGCGSGCGNMVQSGRCGSGCGSGCGNMVKSGGCGSECGSGCGNMVQSGGCGSGCGNMVQNGGGCGSGCGGGCKGFGGYGGVVKSGGCGGSGGCGSGCSGHNLLHNDNVGACDLPKVEASIVNEHVAA
ncbi:glycine-rich domain-containing protein 1-like [Chenopodium quinoa]|uniref:glycine-rich domain-containing protein 1-like n=1 Tax=Chenopodium quinoa TaxID=63459 RepID=UPI000B7762D9|nr:glycine-rich domain-containing protein 1-like [Chenopodium quinoa]